MKIEILSSNSNAPLKNKVNNFLASIADKKIEHILQSSDNYITTISIFYKDKENQCQ